MSRSSSPRTNPATPSSDPVSEEAPGVRTEGEVIADEQAAQEQAANSAPAGATGNPVTNATDEQLAAAKAAADRADDDEETGTLVHYLRESDGTVQSVNEGTDAHGILEAAAEWTKTTRARAVKAAKGDI